MLAAVKLVGRYQALVYVNDKQNHAVCDLIEVPNLYRSNTGERFRTDDRQIRFVQ